MSLLIVASFVSDATAKKRGYGVRGTPGSDGRSSRFELGTEVSWFEYEEPGFMEEEGLFYGIYARSEYRWQENSRVDSWKDLFGATSHFNSLSIDVMAAWGEVDYTSVSSGSMDDIDDYMAELRATAGYDFPASPSLTVTPYLGLGFRYLNDDSGGRVTTTGHLGYERESRYFYLPVGLALSKDFDNGWEIGFHAEYDVFLNGTQKSHLGDAVAGLGTLENDQDDGYGVRGGLRIVRKSDRFDIAFEPYIRHWEIEDSEISPVVYSGVAVGFGLEPENKHTQYGVRLGISF